MEARIKRVKISPQAFFHIMRNGTAWKVIKGIPPGAKLKGFTVDPYTTELNLFVEHESFELVEIHEVVAPVLETEFRKIQ